NTGARLRWLCVGQARPCRKPPRALGASRLTSSFHFSRQRSPFARQEPLYRTRILPKPRRLRRFSISDARFALFNIKRDIAPLSVQSHYRTFNPITGVSAPVPRIDTLTLMAAGHLGFSLGNGTTGSCVPYQSRSHAHAAFMPGAGWAISRRLP